jgi:hypothetical protein
MTTRHKIYVVRQFVYIHGVTVTVERDFTNSKGKNTKVYNHSQVQFLNTPDSSHSKAPYFLTSFPFSIPSFFFLTKWSYYTGYNTAAPALCSALLSSHALYHIYRRVTSWLRNFFFKKAAANFFLSFRLPT